MQICEPVLTLNSFFASNENSQAQNSVFAIIWTIMLNIFFKIIFFWMFYFWSIFQFLLLFLLQTVFCSEEEERLIGHLFRDYNKLIRPVELINKTVEVQFSMYLIQLINVVSLIV